MSNKLVQKYDVISTDILSQLGFAGDHDSGYQVTIDGVIYETNGKDRWSIVSEEDLTPSTTLANLGDAGIGNKVSAGGILAENIGGRWELKTDKKSYGQFYKKLDGRAIIDTSALTDSDFSYAGATNTHSMMGSAWFDGSNAIYATNAGGSGATLNVSKTLATSITAPTVAPSLLIPIYIEDYKKVNGITIMLGSSSAFATYWYFIYNVGPSAAARFQYNGWHLVKIGASDWVAGGSTVPTDWSWSITDVRIKWVNASGVTSSSIAFDDWKFNHKAKAKIILTTDIAYYDSNFRFLRQLGKSLNIPITMAVTPYYVGYSSVYCTLDQIKELVAEGNGLAFRTNYAMNTFSDTASAIAHVKETQQYLIDNFGEAGKNGARFQVYNQGIYWLSGSSATFGDTSLPAAIAAQCGVVAARSTKTTNYPDHMVNGADAYPPNISHCGIIGNWSAQAVTYIKSQIDLAIERGTTIHFFWHNLTDDGVVGNVETAAGASDIMDYIALKRSQGLIDPMRWDEWHYGLTA